MLNAFAASSRWLPWLAIVLMTMVTGGLAQEVKEEKKEEDRFSVPDTKDPTELMGFIKKLMEFEPQSREEAREYNDKSPGAVKLAAERILEEDKEGTSEAAQFATRVLLQMRVLALNDVSAEEQKKVFEDVRDFLAKKEKPERVDLGIAVRVAQSLEMLGNPAAADAYKTFGEILSKNEEKQIAAHGEMMIGAARRMDLVGNAMELTGDTVDGTPFNLEDWKGKVVLVDFWATWCGPCVAEIPHVKEMYEKYHEKGFEVVGISLDDNRGALDNFLKEKSIPWTILHEKGGSGNHPAAQHYGIMAIPFMALVDREGKVISIEARGEELTKLLDKQFEEAN